MARNPRVSEILMQLLDGVNTGGGDVDQCLLTTDGWVLIEWLCCDPYWAKKIGVHASHPSRYKKNWHKFTGLKAVADAINASELTLINYDNRESPSQQYSVLKDVVVSGESQASFDIVESRRYPEDKAATFSQMRDYMNELYSIQHPDMLGTSRLEQVTRFSTDLNAILYVLEENGDGTYTVHRNPEISGDDIISSEKEVHLDSIQEFSYTYRELMGVAGKGSKPLGSVRGYTEDRAAAAVNALLQGRNWIDIHSLFSPRASTGERWVVFEFVLPK